MARWSSLKEVLIPAVNNWRLWLLQFFGNVVIFLAFVWWLRLPDAHWWQLLFGLALILLTAAAALVLHGGTLNYFQNAHQDRGAPLLPAFRKVLKHLPALAVCVLILHFPWGLSGHLDAYNTSFPGYLRSEFPAWLRRMISEPALDNIYIFLVSVLRWVVLPGLLLPFALFCADRGFRGLIAFRNWRGMLRSLGYWLTLVVAAILAVYCVDKILHWTLDPKTATLQAEKASLFFRLLFAYLLGLFSWLLTCSVLGRRAARSLGQPSAQPK